MGKPASERRSDDEASAVLHSANLERVRGATLSTMRSAIVVLRPRQWAKNVTVFVPLVTSHNIFDSHLAMAATIAFLSFCLCASATYIFNDLVDVDHDRQHPTKRNRPFAAGALPTTWALPLGTALLILGLALSATMLPLTFCAVLAVYLAATCTYSLVTKRIVMLDVLTLAGLYTIRVLGGGLATGIPVSEWLIAFSGFFFLSLAFAKRYAELENLLRTNKVAAVGRDYRTSDIGLIESIGPTSGYLAVLVFALYLNDERMKAFYKNSSPLWLICPVLLYWISRIWILAKRGELSEDPVVFALGDPISRYVGVLIAVLLIVATLP